MMNTMDTDDKRNDYRINDLLQAFKDAGYKKSRSWVYRQEEKGNLNVPKSPTEYKKSQGTRPIGFVRLMSRKMIDNIVKEFTPGGNGYYDYTKDQNLA